MLKYRVFYAGENLFTGETYFTVGKRFWLFFWKHGDDLFTSYEHACEEAEILNNKERTNA